MIVGGEFIHANFYGDIVGEYMYAKWRWFRIFISNGVIWILCIKWFRMFIYIQWWWCWWVVVEHVHNVSYVHAWVLGCLHPGVWFEYFVFNGLGYLYPVVWFEYFVLNGYDVFVASWGDNMLLLVMVPCPYRSHV